MGLVMEGSFSFPNELERSCRCILFCVFEVIDKKVDFCNVHGLFHEGLPSTKKGFGILGFGKFCMAFLRLEQFPTIRWHSDSL